MFGLIGVTGGIVATLGAMDADPATYAQVCFVWGGLGRRGVRRHRGELGAVDADPATYAQVGRSQGLAWVQGAVLFAVLNPPDKLEASRAALPG
jgi:hypothetical protein